MSGPSGPSLEFVELTQVGATGMTATFEYPSGIEAGQALTQRFQFTARDIIRNKNAWSGIYLTRNDDLISSGPLGATGPAGPTGLTGPISTNSPFLYQTPVVRFIDPLTPSLDDARPIDVSGLTGPSGPPPSQPRYLGAHIYNMLAAVLGLGPQSPIHAPANLSILCRYAFNIAGGIPASIPVCFVPTRLLPPLAVPAFSAELASMVDLWRVQNQPSGPDGRLLFDVTVFTPLVGATRSGRIAEADRRV